MTLIISSCSKPEERSSELHPATIDITERPEDIFPFNSAYISGNVCGLTANKIFPSSFKISKLSSTQFTLYVVSKYSLLSGIGSLT